ncbi:hypothetical protein [Acetobacterium wieringae]|uniref:Uncharacterized protein n=1 Tax=Acetobacterium wieringae TaxID=52694 RepID=A0A1F2PJH0_9FIRM|nr:hypothetical protein [Acetobacterium wieringae]OFV71483.1 hypothetical protein ACWI_09830 [Acetobacterium wieringae]
MANGQNASLSVGMDQILQLGEVTARILYAIVESEKAKMMKQAAGVGQTAEKPAVGETGDETSTVKVENQAVAENSNLIDTDLLNKLDSAFNEFLLVSRQVINQTLEPVIDLKNMEQLIDPNPITREEKKLAKEINALDQAVERTSKSLKQFSDAARDRRIPRRTVIRSLGEKMIQLDDKRIAVAQGIENYFSNMTNRARIGFATWIVNQFDGINSRFEQIKNVANQQIDEINRAEKNNPVREAASETVANSQTNTLSVDSNSPEIDKIRDLLLTMENTMSDLMRAIHAINQSPSETRTVSNDANPIITSEAAKTQENDGEIKVDPVMANASVTDRIYHVDEYGLMLLDLHDGFDADPQKLADFIQFSTRFQQYTTKNQQLIFAQNANAIQVANVHDLLENGIQVRSGEKPIKVFVPNEANEGPRFVMGSIYDITQTNLSESEYPDIKSSEQMVENKNLTAGILEYCQATIKPNYDGLEGQLEAQGVALMLLAHNNLKAPGELNEKLKKTYQAYRETLQGSPSDQQKRLDATFKSMNKTFQDHVAELDQYLSHQPVTPEESSLKRELEERQEETWEPEM